MTTDTRRRFLKGSGLATVGAIAAAVVPKAAGAAGAEPEVRYYPNDNLVFAIVRAWSEESFRARLLTFKFDESADWSKFSTVDYGTMVAKTRDALAEVDVFLDAPVVLTQKQYVEYKPKDPQKEVVFVLPDPSIVHDKKYSLATARVAMSVTSRGI
jgi:hypothetical protein